MIRVPIPVILFQEIILKNYSKIILCLIGLHLGCLPQFLNRKGERNDNFKKRSLTFFSGHSNRAKSKEWGKGFMWARNEDFVLLYFDNPNPDKPERIATKAQRHKK